MGEFCNAAFVNGGFEDGVFTPWVLGAGNQNLVLFLPQSGTYSAELENIGVDPGSVAQEIVNAGIDCVIVFWVRVGGWAVGNEALWEGSYQVKLHSPNGDFTVGPLDTSLTPIWGEWKKMAVRWPPELTGTPISVTIESLNNVINVDNFGTLDLPTNAGVMFAGQFPEYGDTQITIEKEIDTVWTNMRTTDLDSRGYYDWGSTYKSSPDGKLEGNYRVRIDGITAAIEVFSAIDFYLEGYWIMGGGSQWGATIHKRTWNDRPRTAVKFQGVTEGAGTVEIKRYYEPQATWESIALGTADQSGHFTIPEVGYSNLIPGRDKQGTYKIYLDGVEKETVEMTGMDFDYEGRDVLHMQFKGEMGGGIGCPTVVNGDFETGTMDGWSKGDYMWVYIDDSDPFEGTYCMISNYYP